MIIADLMRKFASLNMRRMLEQIGDFLDDKVYTFTIQPVDMKDGGEECRDYLKRWYLFRLTDEVRAKHPKLHHLLSFMKGILGIEIYLHKISDDDSDRHLHDHPWDMVAVSLVGGYNEIVPHHSTDGVHEEDRMVVSHDAPTYHVKTCRSFHSVQLKRDEKGDKIVNWSLVIRGRKKKDWGFSTEDGWLDHKSYLDLLYGEGKWERELEDMNEEVAS